MTRTMLCDMRRSDGMRSPDEREMPVDAMQPLYYGPRGPYGTEQEALDSSQQRATGGSDQRTANLAALLAASSDAGVELGSYDHRVLTWLADSEPQIVEVVAAIIERAAVARRLRGVVATAPSG